MLKVSPGTYVAGYWVRRLVARGDATEVYEVVDQNGVRRALKVLERQGPLDSAPQRRVALAATRASPRVTTSPGLHGPQARDQQSSSRVQVTGWSAPARWRSLFGASF
jgi:hypothetical protein